MLSHSFTYDQRNHESWLGIEDKMRVPDDAAFERRYQEFLAWVSGDELEPPALYFYPRVCENQTSINGLSLQRCRGI